MFTLLSFAPCRLRSVSAPCGLRVYITFFRAVQAAFGFRAVWAASRRVGSVFPRRVGCVAPCRQHFSAPCRLHRAVWAAFFRAVEAASRRVGCVRFPYCIVFLGGSWPALTPVPLWSRRCGLVGVAKHALSPLFPPPAPHPFKACLKGWRCGLSGGVRAGE